MRRPFTTLLAMFLLLALVADADARSRRRGRTVYYSSGYYVPDGTIYYSSGSSGTDYYSSRNYMPDSTVIVERPAPGEIRYYPPGTVVSRGTTTRSYYYEPGTNYIYPQSDGVIYRTRGRMRR